MNMNHADPLAPHGRACKAGKSSEDSIETNQGGEPQK
jgi:hypothetical protein